MKQRKFFSFVSLFLLIMGGLFLSSCANAGAGVNRANSGTKKDNLSATPSPSTFAGTYVGVMDGDDTKGITIIVGSDGTVTGTIDEQGNIIATDSDGNDFNGNLSGATGSGIYEKADGKNGTWTVKDTSKMGDPGRFAGSYSGKLSNKATLTITIDGSGNVTVNVAYVSKGYGAVDGDGNITFSASNNIFNGTVTEAGSASGNYHTVGDVDGTWSANK